MILFELILYYGADNDEAREDVLEFDIISLDSSSISEYEYSN